MSTFAAAAEDEAAASAELRAASCASAVMRQYGQPGRQGDDERGSTWVLQRHGRNFSSISGISAYFCARAVIRIKGRFGR